MRTTSSAKATPDHPIDGEVDGEYNEPEKHLKSSRELGRIDDGDDVTLDETDRVFGRTTRTTQRILDRGQRAEPPEEYDRCTPDGRRKMNPWHPSPAKREKTSEHDEEDEREMREDDEFSGDTVEHWECRTPLRLLGRRIPDR